MTTFSAQVGSWTSKSMDRVKAVRNDAAQTVDEEVKKPRSEGGHMRYKTGYLAASLMGSTASMPRINPAGQPTPGQTYSPDSNQINLVIAGASLTDTIYLGFTANYAAPREHVDGFVKLVAQRWPAIVKASAASIRSRVEAR